jgi:glycosyltransferase involved in cell wall biosynthesis
MTPKKYTLLWVGTGSLEKSLDAATWLDTSRELCKSGWQVMLIVVGTAGQKLFHGVQILNFPRPEIYLLRQLIFHAQILTFILQRLDTFDVILFHSMSAPWMVPLRIVRWLRNRQFPVLVMDTRTVEMSHEGKEGWKDRLRRCFHLFVEKRTNSWVDGRLAITQRMANVVGIPQEKLWGVWPSGVDQDLFSPSRAVRKWPLAGEEIRLVYIGVLNYERNLMIFSRAVEKANAEGMRFTLALVGEGTERADLEIFANQTNGRICVSLPVPHSQVPDVLAQAHIGVLPFPDEEKFQVSSPIKLFEYMAAGLPILATRIACHTDVVGNGDFAFWAEQSDEARLLSALRLIWDNSNRLSEMGCHSAIAAQGWTWRESAKKLRAALETGLEKYASGILLWLLLK